tara:strand:- start:49 stop:738 length:690 start_codon:yes stop_codon:yes gene_type:complete
MWTYLFGSIELFSNHKSFSLWVDTTRNLWLLLHFKDLEIKSKTLIYQVNNGNRQRKSTVHPYRKMQKKHKNTAELLDYLNTKSYDIYQLEIEFTNGWKIKQIPRVEFYFYTNSTSERDDLIDKLLAISGQGPIDVSNLEPNFSYSFRGHTKLVKIDIDGLPSPDEFWPEEEVNAWRESVWKAEKEEALKLENTTDQASGQINVPFVSSMNISKDSFGVKLEDRNEGGPF